MLDGLNLNLVRRKLSLTLFDGSLQPLKMGKQIDISKMWSMVDQNSFNNLHRPNLDIVSADTAF